MVEFGDGRLPPRFWGKVAIDGETGCWRWTGYLTKRGYGTFRWNGHNAKRAHRVAFIELRGGIPDGLELDHLCRQRSCVNPAHLEPVSTRENVLRGTGPTATNAAKTHCPAGHPYDAANTYANSKGRACRACTNARRKRLRERAKLSGSGEGG